MFRRVIAVPAVLSLAAALLAGVSFAPVATAADCGPNQYRDQSGQCINKPATETQTAPQMMPCWDGSQVPMGSACPVAPATGSQTQTQTQTQTQFTTCWNGTQVPIGSACPVAPTATTQTGTQTGTQTQFTTCWNGSQVPLGSSCPAGSPTAGTGGVSYCPDGITINTGAAGSCPTTSAGSNNTGVTCSAGTFYDSGTKSCKSSTTTYCSNGTVNTTGSASGCSTGSTAVNSGPGYCANGYFWSDASKSCQQITASTGTTNASLGYCPDGITTVSASGTACPGQTATVKCSDGSYKFAAQLCPGQTPSTATGTNATSGVAYCADGITINTGAVGSCPSKTSATSCPAGTFFDQGINGCKSSSVSTASVNQSCPAGSYYNQGAGGCTSSTAQVATIKCADGSYRVTALECQNSGGAVGSIVSSATGATCSSGYAPNSSGYCVPISNNASATQTIKCWDGSQVPITSACPTAPANGASGGINCPSGSFFDSGINGCKTLVATAAGSALGGACLEGYAPNSSGFCIPTASLTAAGGKSTGPISTQIDPCKVVPVPPSCIASGAVTVTERTVVQAQAARFTPPPSASADAPPPSGAKEATGLVAPPAKNGKKAPPVLVFNVLGADNKELTDSDGKTLTTKPAVKAGNTVFVDKNGSPVITAPTLDPAGKPVTGPDGNVLYTKLMTFAGQEPVTDSTGKAVTAAPLLAANGKPLQAANGKVVYAPPVLDVKGNVILNSYGAPVLAQPLSDSSGSIAVGPDGEPICIQPIVVEGGKAIVKNGAKVYVGAVGVPALTSKNQTITTAFGQDVTFGPSGTLADEGGNAVLGPDGRPVMLTATGTPIASNGAPLLDKNGKPIRVTATGGVTDSSGRPILGADGKQIVLGKAEAATQLKSGKNVIKSADGKQVTVGLNGALVDLNGNPVLTSAGKPIFIDPATKSFKDPTGKAVTVSKTGVLTSAKSNPLQVETGAIDAA